MNLKKAHSCLRYRTFYNNLENLMKIIKQKMMMTVYKNSVFFLFKNLLVHKTFCYTIKDGFFVKNI